MVFRRSRIPLLIIILLLISASIVGAIPQWAKTGLYLVFEKKAEVVVYAKSGFEVDLTKVLNGYCIEKAKYVITRVGDQGFIMEKHRLSFMNKSLSPILCKYLSIIDNGQKKSWDLNKSGFRVLMFDWFFKYSGVVFSELSYRDYLFPWVEKLYIYIPPTTGITQINTSTTHIPSHDIEGIDTSFYNHLKAMYSRQSGFLTYIYYSGVIAFYGKAVIGIAFEARLIDTNINIKPFTEIILYNTLVVLVIASIATITIYYILFKR